MRKQFAVFLVRWLLISLGLWLASKIIDGSFHDTNSTTSTFLLAGFILSIVNTVLKPIVVVLALPAILLTLGLFMLVVNGLMVYITLKLTPGLDVTFVGAIVSGMIISLINYALSGIIDIRNKPQESIQT